MSSAAQQSVRGLGNQSINPELNNGNPQRQDRLASMLAAMQLSSGANREGTQKAQEMPITTASGDLFTGPDTESFAQPSLQDQAPQLGTAQPLDSSAWNEQADQKPVNPLAQAFRQIGGTKTDSEQALANNSAQEQAPKPATVSKTELFTQMNEARKAIDAQQLKAVQAELAREVQEAKRATIQLKNTAPALRNAALGLENNQHNAGVGKSHFAHQLAILASRVFARQENLAQLAKQELAAKRAKQAQQSGGKAVETKSVAETRTAHEQLREEKVVNGGA